VLLASPRVLAVRCAGHDVVDEPVSTAAVVLVRRGAFVRQGRVADVTTGYLQRPGEWQRVSHPRGGDVCTSIGLGPETTERFAGTVVRVPATADLIHRRLIVSRSLDREDLAAELVDALLPADGATTGWHPAVETVREMLCANPSHDLATLASAVGWSPWWLSRRFRAAAGETLNAYRRRLRVREALDSLGGDERPDLAAIAVRCGFADQAHMTRAVRRETGMAPGALHRSLRAL
jgi:AraC-like DNA-binding protein